MMPAASGSMRCLPVECSFTLFGLKVRSGNHRDRLQYPLTQISIAPNLRPCQRVSSTNPPRKNLPSVLGCNAYVRSRTAVVSLKELPVLGLAYQGPFLLENSVQHEPHRCALRRGHTTKRPRQRPHKRIHDGLKQAPLVQSPTPRRIPNLLLMMPALCIFTRYIEPHRHRLSPRPVHRSAPCKRIEPGKILIRLPPHMLQQITQQCD